MRATAIAPGTCGELVQGICDGTNFLVSCPINLYSKVTVEIDKATDKISINSKEKYKIVEAVKKTMLKLNKEIVGARVFACSNLPIGKGMASSTADISAACLATAKALNKNIKAEEIAKIALEIEPTDGSFFSGIVAFDHVYGSFYEYLGEALDIDVLVFDCGGEINTIDFNKRPDLLEKNLGKEEKIKEAFRLISEGIKNKDKKMIARGSTISALANQDIIYKRDLDEILEDALEEGVLGLNIAHSGTLFGLLCEKEKIDMDFLIKKLCSKYNHISFNGIYKFISGGLKLSEGEDLRWNNYENMAEISGR